jgi:hypothetical protein
LRREDALRIANKLDQPGPRLARVNNVLAGRLSRQKRRGQRLKPGLYLLALGFRVVTAGDSCRMSTPPPIFAADPAKLAHLTA